MPLNMKTAIYFVAAVLLVAAAFVVFRIIVRGEYRKKGRLTFFTSCLELLIWSLYMAFPYLYNPPQWVWFLSPEVPASLPLRAIGVACISFGLVAAFGTMFWFGLRRAFGLQADGLVQSGPYRWSRNPQMVGLGLIVIGVAVLWPSWYAAGWVVLAGILEQMMVMTEEEYLRAVYGEAYARYCAQVPRYIGLP